MTIRGKWAISLLIVLAISLSLNLFVAGFAATRFHGLGRGSGIEHMIGAFVTRFPREIRHNLRQQIDEVRPELTREFHELGQARRHMFSLMRESQLDIAALEKAMSDVRAQLNEAQSVGQRAVLRAIETAAAESRAEIGEGWGGWWHRRHHGPQDQ